MFRYPGCVRIVSDHKLVPRSGLCTANRHSRRGNVLHSPAPADVVRQGKWKNCSTTACRSLLPSTCKRPTRIDHIIDQEDRGRANLPGIDFKDIFQVRQLSEPILFLQGFVALRRPLPFPRRTIWKCQPLPSLNYYRVFSSHFQNDPPPQSADEGAGDGAK